MHHCQIVRRSVGTKLCLVEYTQHCTINSGEAQRGTWGDMAPQSISYNWSFLLLFSWIIIVIYIHKLWTFEDVNIHNMWIYVYT